MLVFAHIRLGFLEVCLFCVFSKKTTLIKENIPITFKKIWEPNLFVEKGEKKNEILNAGRLLMLRSFVQYEY